jgi:hypothetical protein
MPCGLSSSTMRIVVKYHARVELPLREALASLARRSPGGRALARLAVELIRDRLSRTAGRLPGVLVEQTVEPAVHWWEFAREFWVGFVIRDRGFWRWRRRDITIFEVRERPPDRAASTSLRD